MNKSQELLLSMRIYSISSIEECRKKCGRWWLRFSLLQWQEMDKNCISVGSGSILWPISFFQNSMRFISTWRAVNVPQIVHVDGFISKFCINQLRFLKNFQTNRSRSAVNFIDIAANSIWFRIKAGRTKAQNIYFDTYFLPYVNNQTTTMLAWLKWIYLNLKYFKIQNGDKQRKYFYVFSMQNKNLPWYYIF